MFIVSVFTKMSSQPSLWLKNTAIYCDTLSSQHGCSVRGPSGALPTVCLLPVLASVCVCVRMNDFFVSDLYSLLPAIASSLSQPTRRASMHSNTLVLYLSSGLDCVFCQTRVKWLYDNVILLQTYCEIVLVFSACSEWTLIKMMIQNIVVWLIVFFVLAH